MTKLEEAERAIRVCAEKDMHSVCVSPSCCKAIADELDRLREQHESDDDQAAMVQSILNDANREIETLRAELAALKGEAESTVYAVGTTADVAVACALAVQWWHQAEECQPVEGQDVYAIRVSAKKVER